MSFSGGMDLSGLANAQSAANAGASYVIELNETNLQTTLQASINHIVVVNLWSPRAQGYAEFNAVLEQVVNSLDGQILLGQVDVDANPAIGQAFQVQSVPMVVGVIGGRPVPLFQSTASEADVRRVFEELVTVAVQSGVTGRAQPVSAGSEAADAEDEGPDPRFAAADAALETGDFDAAIAAYEHMLAQNPADDEAAERLAGVQLLKRVQGVDLQAARQAAADAPGDLDAQLLVADLDVSGGHLEDAFARLIDLVRTTTGDERERVRSHLVGLFTVAGSEDPRVASARRSLAAVLF